MTATTSQALLGLLALTLPLAACEDSGCPPPPRDCEPGISLALNGGDVAWDDLYVSLELRQDGTVVSANEGVCDSSDPVLDDDSVCLFGGSDPDWYVSARMGDNGSYELFWRPTDIEFSGESTYEVRVLLGSEVLVSEIETRDESPNGAQCGTCFTAIGKLSS